MPIVGVNAIKVPSPSPPAIALGVLRNLMAHLSTGRNRIRMFSLFFLGGVFIISYNSWLSVQPAGSIFHRGKVYLPQQSKYSLSKLPG